MKNQDFSNIEEQIKDAVQDALESMDFGSLNQKISGSIGNALDEVRKQVKNAGQQVDSAMKSSRDKVVDMPKREEKHQYGPQPSKTIKKDKSQYGGTIQRSKPEPPSYSAQRSRAQSPSYSGQRSRTASPPEDKKYASKIRPKGNIAAVLYTVFGCIGAGITGIGLAVTAAAMMAWGSSGVVQMTAMIFLLPLFAVFCTMCGYGAVLRSRLKRLKRYMKILNGKTYCSIRELAEFSAKSEKYVKKDLQKMIQLGLIPEGHLDRQGACLMLDDQTYAQYMETQKAMDQRIAEEKIQNAKLEKAAKSENASKGKNADKAGSTLKDAAAGKSNMPFADNAELEAMIDEGHAYIRKLRKINDAIPGEVISAKLSRLETITGKIFDTVGKQPQQMPQMQKFMDYYLPTTLKLLTAYQEFDSVDSQGDNITSAKDEIEKTLDTINLAFEKLLDDLYQDAVFDVTTDASVLQTMLAREGLTESDFKEELKL